MTHSLSFDAQTLREHLLRCKIATLADLKRALGTTGNLTVFNRLKFLDYLSSYTHRGRYYALREAARFDSAGLWSHDAVWFSRLGTLQATVEGFVDQSPRGCFADELADTLHVEVHNTLQDLVRAGRLRRLELTERFLYTSANGSWAKEQLRTRRTTQAVPFVSGASSLTVSPSELKTAILAFYNGLSEQQRRLFTGLESLKLGYGGDGIVAGFFGSD